MNNQALFDFSRAFHDAVATANMALVETLLDDEIQWSIFGPIDHFSFFGERRGKAEVMAAIADLSRAIEFHGFDRERLVVAGNEACSMLNYYFTDRRSGRRCSVRIAHFSQFRNGRLVNLRVVVDTFDMIEQALGHEIELAPAK